MFESFDNYLRSIGYGGIMALAILTAVVVSVAIIGVVFWLNPLPKAPPSRERG
jgi:hypothetical protein